MELHNLHKYKYIINLLMTHTVIFSFLYRDPILFQPYI